MREIKFRGKRTDNGEWAYGYYVAECGKHGILVDTSKDDGLLRRLWVEVDPKTVGQFAGLHDKNGVEIYEGDIISDGRIGEVEYVPEHASFLVRTKEGDCQCYQRLEGDGQLRETEVIGNIYENPELIK